MPVNYGSYQIDPFQGFNQGLANIGQALQYRRQMERQNMLDTENKRLRDLQVEESGLRIGGIKAEREALSNLYTPEGTPPLDLAGTITAQMKKEQEEKNLTTRNARFKFYLDVHKSLGGSPEEKNKVMQNLVAKDPDEDIKKIAPDLKIAGGKISFTQTVKENEVKLPDGTFAQPGVYDIEGEETGDPNKPVRITGAKRREEKVIAEKGANIHYETDEKGNTVKIVSDPLTGKTISQENMGKIGKPKSTIDEEKEKRQIGKDVAGLRKEFDALKEVKDYKDVRSKIQVMEKALVQSKTSQSKVAVDQALITLFNKMTDPQSVVRESEYIRTPENMALYSRIVGKIEKIRQGGAGLTDVERNALINMAREFYKTYEGLYNQQTENYREYATKSGLDPDMVIKGNIKQTEETELWENSPGGKQFNIPKVVIDEFKKDWPKARRIK